MADEVEIPDRLEGEPLGFTYADQLQRRIDRIERERRRVGFADWSTLFRQIRTLCEQLAKTPFILGDLEAEMRLDQVLLAPDLEEFDRRVDHLAEYIEAKLAFNAAVKAEETGAPTEDAPRLRSRVPAAPGLSRMAAAAGPSGSDFDLDDPSNTAENGPSPRRRGVLRL